MTTRQKFCQCGAQTRTTKARYCNACGASLVPPAQGTQTGPLTGTIHNGQYKILRLLGMGGMGAVYLAEDLLFGNRQVAVKEMSQSSLSPSELVPAVVAFKQEAMLLGNLRHPNLPRIYAYFDESGRWYMVMDFISGQTLETLLANAPGGCLPVEDVLKIGLQLCTVLKYLHTRQPQIIFRDLKPANIMLEGETLYLIDFGIARHFKPGQKKDTAAIGSSGYAPPEQYGRAQTTPRSDIYSLGATLHHLLSGHDPSDQPFKFASLVQIGVFSSSNPALSDLDALIKQMVTINERLRPNSIQEVMAKLLTIQQMLSSPSTQIIAPHTTSSLSSVGPTTEGSKGLALPTVNIFCVCTPKNKKVLADLRTHLLGSTRDLYHLNIEDEVTPSNDWEKSLEQVLRNSHTTLLFVSTPFLADDKCDRISKKAVLLRSQGIGYVVPVLLEPCTWSNQPYADIQGVPKTTGGSEMKALSLWRPKSLGWQGITGELCAYFKTLHTQGKLKITHGPKSSSTSTSGNTPINSDRLAQLYWDR